MFMAGFLFINMPFAFVKENVSCSSLLVPFTTFHMHQEKKNLNLSKNLNQTTKVIAISENLKKRRDEHRHSHHF